MFKRTKENFYGYQQTVMCFVKINYTAFEIFSKDPCGGGAGGALFQIGLMLVKVSIGL